MGATYYHPKGQLGTSMVSPLHYNISQTQGQLHLPELPSEVGEAMSGQVGGIVSISQRGEGGRFWHKMPASKMGFT